MRSLMGRTASDNIPRDPAPSRMGYRFQRLMLTPGIRLAAKVGLPLVLVGVVAGSWYANPENRAQFAATIEETPIQSRVIEYARTGETGRDELAAVWLEVSAGARRRALLRDPPRRRRRGWPVRA